jgi:hypothetical protein
MRLSRLQFTVRRLLIMLVVAGLALGGSVWGVRMSRLSGEYAGKAQNYKSLEGYHRQYALYLLEQTKSDEKLMAADSPVEDIGNESLTQASKELEKNFAGQASDDFGRVVRAAAKADYYAALARKYERAARYPWLPVEPEP